MFRKQLDYAHLPFVHASSIGKNFDFSQTREVTESDGKISIFLEKNKGASIQFIFPSIWLLTISPEKFYQFIAFVPISELKTRLYLRAYYKAPAAKFFSRAIEPLLNWTNSQILNQDRRVVLSQNPKSSLQANSEKLFNSDKAVSIYRKLLNSGDSELRSKRIHWAPGK